MPCLEIWRIVTTVATVQILVDLIAYWRVYSRPPYQRALDQLTRFKYKWEEQLAKAKPKETITTTTAVVVVKPGSNKKNSGGRNNSSNSSSTSTSNNAAASNMAKRVQRAEDDYKNALADVSRRHLLPNFGASLVILVLMKILGAELQGHIIAILPFEPFRWLRLLTARNLEFHDNGSMEEVGCKVVQACSFTVIYMLTNLSVKFYVHQLFGVKAPSGAESIGSVVDSPMGQSCKYCTTTTTADVGRIGAVAAQWNHNSMIYAAMSV